MPRCPNCGAGPKLLVERYNGNIRCLECGSVFKLLGIKADYPRLPFPKKLKAWIQLVRPLTLLAPIFAALFGIVACLASQGNLAIFWPNSLTIVFVMVTLAMAQAVGQILNQSEENPEVDITNHKAYRPIPSRKAAPDEARALAWILALFAVGRGFTINIQFGFFITTFILFAVLYNCKPFYIKKRLWWNTGLLAVGRGLLPLPAVWSIFGNVTDLTPWLIGISMFFWSLSFQNSKDLGDIEGDKKFGIITPSVYHGIKRLSLITVPISALSFILLTNFVLLHLLPLSYLLLLLLTVPTSFMHVAWIRGSYKNIILPTENQIIWVGFYGVLSGWFLLTAIAAIL